LKEKIFMPDIKTRAAMPGNPSFYEDGLQDYSVESLSKLKDKGINTIFINLAWSRPHIDSVCLEHTAVSKSFPLLSAENVTGNRQKIKKRVENVKSLGLKAMAIFGIPQYFDYTRLPENYKCLMGASKSTIADASVTCIESPDVMTLYKELIADFLGNIPDIDGMLIYTYDELAEVCDEDSDCPRCKGIPQEERIPKFLNKLYSYCLTIKDDFEIWWEPWELSWSQVYGTLKKLNINIKVACHSNIHEVYYCNHPDLWFRSIAALCDEQGRDMIGELFMGGTGEDLGFTPMYPCPRLVFEQIDSTSKIKGVTGIKEYYGICTKFMSVNETVMGEYFNGNFNYDEIINNTADEYTPDKESKNLLLKYWSFSSRVLELLPWEVSWVLRFSNYHPYDEAYWGKVSFANLMKTPWNTPSWLSNRRSYYMVTDNTVNMNSEYCSDIIKRFNFCIELINEGLEFAEKVTVCEPYDFILKTQIESTHMLKSLIMCRLNHLLLSLKMEQLRNGRAVLSDISDLLIKEKENALYLINLIKNSKIHYMLNIETINRGINSINEFIGNVNEGESAVLNKYNNL
jgi:hypothetical protein